MSAGGWTTGVVVGDFWQNVTTGASGGSTLAEGRTRQHRARAQHEHQQPDDDPDRLHTTECPVGVLPLRLRRGSRLRITLEGTENTPPSVTDRAPYGERPVRVESTRG